MRRLNLRVLFAIVGTTIGVVVTVVVIHEIQSYGNAAKLLRAAEDHKTKGRIDRTMEFLDRYLTLRPNDAKVLSELATLQSEGPPSLRESAMNLWEKALRID